MAVPDDYSEHLKQQILGAYGFDSEAELDAAIEEQLPGYLAAEAERKAREEAYAAQLPDRLEEAAAAVTAWGQAHGMLPDGVELVPISLEADAQWIASAPPQFTGLLTATEGEYAGPAEPPRMRAEVQSLAAAFEMSARQVADWWAAVAPTFVTAFTQVCEGLTATALALQKLGLPFQIRNGVRSCPHRPLHEACDFCYPKPFPAARDYRRRTKHRNRRRKS